MSDLSSEIEARKQRIAELRRQREAHASQVKTKNASPLSISVNPAPVAEIRPVTLYTKVTRAAQLPKQTHVPINQPIEAPKPEKDVAAKENEFQVVDEEITPSLLAFADDAYRAIARSKTTSAFVHFSERQDSSNLIDLAKSGGKLYPIVAVETPAAKIAFSPHIRDFVALRCADPRRIEIYSLNAYNSTNSPRPEFTLRSPTALTTDVVFHPTNRRFVFCGGANGQLLAWDLFPRGSNDKNTDGDGDSAGGSLGRYELLPQIRSPADGNRIISLSFPHQSNSLISLSDNGVLCVWPGGDRLTKPQHRIVLDDALRSALHSLRVGVLVPFCVTTCFPPNYAFGLGYGTGLTVLGSVSGNLLYLPALPSATSVGWPHWRHDAPVCSLDFRSEGYTLLESGKQFAVLCSAGMDWKIKVWLVPVEDHQNQEPLQVAQISVDFAVKKVSWHPSSPAVIVAAGESVCELFDLNKSFAAPIVSSSQPGVVEDFAFGGSCVALATSESVEVCGLPETTGGDDWVTVEGQSGR